MTSADEAPPPTLDLPAAADAPALAQPAVDRLVGAGLRVAVAESCTAGAVSARLALADGAGDCLVGALVAYDAAVKHRLLGVEPGPVVSRAAAEQMAAGVAHLFGVPVGLATTGVVGPARQEGRPVGCLWIALARDDEVRARQVQIAAAAPEAVRDRAVAAAIGALAGRVHLAATHR